MGFMFCDLHVLSNNPSLGGVNSSNLSCSCQAPPTLNGYINKFSCLYVYIEQRFINYVSGPLVKNQIYHISISKQSRS